MNKFKKYCYKPRTNTVDPSLSSDLTDIVDPSLFYFPDTVDSSLVSGPTHTNGSNLNSDPEMEFVSSDANGSDPNADSEIIQTFVSNDTNGSDPNFYPEITQVFSLWDNT